MKKYITYSDLSRGREPTDLEKVGKVTSQSVLKFTGKPWKEWVEILNQAGAHSWTHQEIVAHLKKKHKLTPWWQQGVAQGFEIAIGRRSEGQDLKGKYMVTATKTLPVGVQKVWNFLLSPAGLQLWLQPLSDVEINPKVQFETVDGFFGEVRTVTRNRRARLYWQDPEWEKHTVLELMLVPRAGGKSILIFNHTSIQDVKTQKRLRERWKNATQSISEQFPND